MMGMARILRHAIAGGDILQHLAGIQMLIDLYDGRFLTGGGFDAIGTHVNHDPLLLESGVTPDLIYQAIVEEEIGREQQSAFAAEQVTAQYHARSEGIWT